MEVSWNGGTLSLKWMFIMKNPTKIAKKCMIWGSPFVRKQSFIYAVMG